MRFACAHGVQDVLLDLPERGLRTPLLNAYLRLTNGARSEGEGYGWPRLRWLEFEDDFRFLGHDDEVALDVHRVFFESVCLALEAEGAFTDLWSKQLTGNRWAIGFLRTLAEAARGIAEVLRRGETPTVAELLEPLRLVPVPRWPQERTARRMLGPLQVGVNAIVADLQLLASARSEYQKLTVDDVLSLRSSPYIDVQSWVAEQVLSGWQELSDEAALAVVKEELSELDGFVESFEERGLYLARLATVLAMYAPPTGEGETTDWSQLRDKVLEQSAQCALGYGYHKDMLSISAVEAITAVAPHRPQAMEALLVAMAQLIGSVEDFTDRDEVRHLPPHVGRALLGVSPPRFLAYYEELLENREYWHAERVYAEYVEHGEGESDEVFEATLRTSLGKHEIEALERRIKRGGGGEAAREDIREFLGAQQKQDPADDETPYSSATPSLDVSDFPPKKLQELIRVVGRYRFGQLAARWLRHWEASTGVESIVEAVEALSPVELRGFEYSEGADLFWELVSRARGPEAAYRWLVHAQRMRHGWAPYFSGRAEAERRWEYIASKLPHRARDFVVDSTTRGSGDQLQVGPFWFERLAMYLVAIGDMDGAETVVEAAVGAAVQIVKGMSLPTPRWSM